MNSITNSFVAVRPDFHTLAKSCVKKVSGFNTLVIEPTYTRNYPREASYRIQEAH